MLRLRNVIMLAAPVAVLMVIWMTVRGAVAPVADPASISKCLAHESNARVTAELSHLITDCTTAIRQPALTDLDRANILLHRGVAYRNLKTFDKSVVDLREAKRVAPESANVARMLAWTLRELGDFQGSEAELDRALQLEPHWQGYLSRCVVVLDRGDTKRALGGCEKAYELNVNEDSIYFSSLAIIADGRHADAIPRLQSGIIRDDASGRLYGTLAKALQAIGESTRSSDIEKEGRARFPDDPQLTFPPPATRRK